MQMQPTALKIAQPELLVDVLAIKRARGDADAGQFKAFASREFAARLNASVKGAANCLRSLTKAGDPNAIIHAKRVAYLAELEAFGG